MGLLVKLTWELKCEPPQVARWQVVHTGSKESLKVVGWGKIITMVL